MTITLSTLILILGTARLTLLITHDELLSPIKNRLLAGKDPEPWYHNLLTCPDCLGIWTSLFALMALALLGPIVIISLAPFAVSMIVSLLARQYG